MKPQEQQHILKAGEALQRWLARDNRGWKKSHRKVRCVAKKVKGKNDAKK